jgi:hypothetical protein
MELYKLWYAKLLQVQALLQDPQGYLGGPGIGSGAYEFVRRMLHRYVNTSLSYLIVLVFLVSTIMDVVEMLDKKT